MFYIHLIIQTNVFLFYADSDCFHLWFASMNFGKNQILHTIIWYNDLEQGGININKLR